MQSTVQYPPLMEEKPIQYTNMSERDLFKWQLDYTMPQIIDDFRAIPDSKLGWCPAEKTRSAGHIFGHIIHTERKHVGCYLQGVNDIPEKYKIFWSLTHTDPTEEKILKAVGSKGELIKYWHEVRKKTYEYLDSISDEDLKEVPKKSLLPDNDINRLNPIREWFVMTIKHQNTGWGEIHMIRRIIESGL